MHKEILNNKNLQSKNTRNLRKQLNLKVTLVVGKLTAGKTFKAAGHIDLRCKMYLVSTNGKLFIIEGETAQIKKLETKMKNIS